MSNEKISLYERFIFSKDTTTFLNSLVVNSADYNFFYLLNELNRVGLSQLSGEAKEKLSSYLESRKKDTSDLVVLKERLLKLEEIRKKGPSGEEELKKALRDFDEQYLSTNFDYSRPPVAGRNASDTDDVDGAEGDNKRYNSTLDLDLVQLESVVQEALKQGFVSELSPLAFYGVDLDVVVKEERVKVFEEVLQQFPNVGSLGTRLINLLETYRKRCTAEENPPRALNRPLYRSMTLTQMSALAKSLPELLHDNIFVYEWFVKQFEKEVKVLRDQREVLSRSYEEIRGIYQRAYDWCVALGEDKQHKEIAAFFLRRILQWDLDHHRVDTKTFLLYLEYPSFMANIYNEPRQKWWRENRESGSRNWGEDLRIPKQEENEDALLKAYLLQIFSQKPSQIDTAPFAKYFDKNTLLSTVYRAKLFAGLEVSPDTSGLSAGELEHFQSAQALRFSRWCRRYFSPGEPTELTLELKNISELTVRIFEIHAENYYRQFHKEITKDISVKGLVPTRSQEFTFDKPPSVIHELQLKDFTGGKKGAFVVECIGSGIQCTAVIIVGALTLIERHVSKGVLFYMVDGAKQLCHGEDTCMRIGNKEYRPSEELGYGMLVPYGSSESISMAVLSHDGFADLARVQIPRFQSTMDLRVVVHEGTVSESGYTKLLLIPKLTAGVKNGGTIVSPSTLRNVEVTVSSIDAKGVRSAQVYKNLEFSGGQPTAEVNYLVPPFVHELNVELRGEVYSTVKEDWESVEEQRTVRIERLDHVQAYADVLLRMEKEGRYKLHYVGRDGESYPGMKVKVLLRSYFKSQSVRAVLKTDANGEIDLGPLRQFADTITVQPLDTPSPELLPERVYDLNCGRQTGMSVPERITLAKGETLQLPAPDNEGVSGIPPFLLFRTESFSAVVSDLTEKVKLVDGLYTCEGMEEGKYVFRYPLQCKEVNVEVSAGHRWDVAPERYLEEREGIVDLGGRRSDLSVHSTPKGNGVVEVTVRSCGGSLNGVRVQALAYSYYPTTLKNLKASFNKDQKGPERYSLQFPLNRLSEQSQLDDETKYVLDRKRRRNPVGNTLEKPPGLLKRHLVRDTKESEPPVGERNMLMADRACRSDEDYLTLEQERAVPMACMARRCKMANMDVGAQLMSQSTAEVDRNSMRSSNDYYVEALTNFLKHSGWVQYNITPDESGKVRIEVPTDCGYSTLVFIAHNDSDCVVGTAPLDRASTPLQPVALPASRAAGRVYVTERRCEKLNTNDTLAIPSTASFFLVDCISAVIQSMQLLSSNTGLEGKWSFLSQWASLTPMQKLEKYDKLTCHEFHCFVYFKDQEFFDSVVRTHLQSKSKKQLIDWLLLGYTGAVKDHLSRVPVGSLSSLEKALIVRLLYKKEPELCRRLSNDLTREVAALEDGTSEERNRRFDSILSGATFQDDMDGDAVAVEDEAIMEEAQFEPPMAPMGGMPAVGGMGFGGAAPMPGARMRMATGAAPRMAMLSMNNAHLDQVISEKKRVVRQFRPKGVTQEFEETQFANGSRLPAIEGLRFWASVAAHFAGENADKPFLDESFMYAAESFTESVIALSILDVPLVKGVHAVERGAENLSVRAASPCMAFYKTLEEKGGERSEEADVIMNQRFIDPSDTHVYDPVRNTRTLKVVKEFIVGKMYGIRVSVTNTADSSCTVRLVTEVPQGAVPVMNHEYTKDQESSLQPLETSVDMFYFYFPREGVFSCMPASVNSEGKLLCSASEVGTLTVVKNPTKQKMQTLSDILSQGEPKDVLHFIESNNWYDRRVFAPEAVYWLLTKNSFYKGLLDYLQRNGIFDPIVWSFSIYHADYDTFHTYLQHLSASGNLTATVFSDTLYLNTGLLSFDHFEYKEYSPLENARVHDVGLYAHNIRNDEFRETYQSFLRYWIEKSPHYVSAKDELYMSTYLLLQDRVEEATAMYDKIDETKLVEEGDRKEVKLQYDYLTAFLDIYRGGPEYTRAREVCMQYITYPVFEWRNRFIDVLNLLAECSGEEVSKTNYGEETDTNKNAREAKDEPSLSCTIKMEEGQVVSTVGHVNRVDVSAFEVDLEVLFSVDPFLDVKKMDYSYLKPNWKVSREVSATTTAAGVPDVVVVDLPDPLKRRNLVIRVDAGPLSETQTYLPCNMHIQLRQEYGVVKVTEKLNPHKPLPRVYVKVYSKNHGGQVKFFKDAYTDLRGCVEYTSVNHTTDFSGISSFSLLILSEEHGATVVQSKPPSNVGTLEATTRQLVSTAMQMQQAQVAGMANNRYFVA